MPQVQYLQRQADPIAAQIASYGNDLADTIQKAQAMRLTKMDIDLRKKQAKTEQDKMEWEQVKDFHDFNDKIDIAVSKGEIPQNIAAKMKARKIADFGGFPMLQKYSTVVMPVQEMIQDGNKKEPSGIPTPEGYNGSTTMAPSESELSVLGPSARLAALKGYSDINLQRVQGQELQAKLEALNKFSNNSGGESSGIVSPSANIGGINLVNSKIQSSLDKQKSIDTQLGQEEANKQIRSELLSSNDNGDYPVGASISGGGLTYTPNPKLDEAQITAVTGSDKFEPLVDRLTKLINDGVLDSGKSRAFTQYLAEGGGDPLRRLLTKDNSPLEELASITNELKKYSFSEGGKNLTPTELKVVQGGLSFVGKSNKQAISDLSEAIRILREKKIYILGGANVSKYKDGSPGSNRVKSMQDQEREIPVNPSKPGGKLMQDAQGNKAIVYPDGTIEEQ